MAPKRANVQRDIPPSSAATTQAGPTAAGSVPATSARAHKTSLATKDGWEQVVGNLWDHYVEATPQRTKLIDAFMAFLVVVGALQFLYCVLAGNYVSRRNGRSDQASLVEKQKKGWSFLLTLVPAGFSHSMPFSPASARLSDSLSLLVRCPMGPSSWSYLLVLFLNAMLTSCRSVKASLRMQTTEANKSNFPAVSPER